MAKSQRHRAGQRAQEVVIALANQAALEAAKRQALTSVDNSGEEMSSIEPRFCDAASARRKTQKVAVALGYGAPGAIDGDPWDLLDDLVFVISDVLNEFPTLQVALPDVFEAIAINAARET